VEELFIVFKFCFPIVVGNVVDPRAYGIAAHNLGVVGLQYFRNDFHGCHAAVEPQVITLAVEDHRHAVVDSRGHGVRGRRQDRA